MPPALTLTDCHAHGVTVVYVSAELATGIDKAAIEVSPVPHLLTPIVVAFQVPVVMVQSVVMFVVPDRVLNAVFSTFHNPTSDFANVTAPV